MSQPTSDNEHPAPSVDPVGADLSCPPPIDRPPPGNQAGNRVVLMTGEALLALLLALGGVVVMVQSGQTLTGDLHIPPVLAGLLVLAVATSLPNTVVAVSLARTGMSAASVEELFSSNSVNAALGLALPLLIWRAALHDPLLPLLDAPLMMALTLAALACVYAGRASRRTGFVLLLTYALWVVAHMLL